MTRAAGILFLAPDKTALFLKRGPGGDHPGEWCFPGGTTEGDELPEQTAVREAIEELGSLPRGHRALLAKTVTNPAAPIVEASPAPLSLVSLQTATAQLAPNLATSNGEVIEFTTFRQHVKEQFVPQINGEHVGYAWAPVTQPPEPLHPGCRIALDRLSMNELGIARAMAAGQLTSPQSYENVTLFAIRITGTGTAYRPSLKEFVFREPDIYMNDEFLARCNGLAVIMQHPKGATLTSAEYNDRNVGSILLPYLKPEAKEVWGIAKIYDAAAIKIMTEELLSTSPAVVFRDPTVNTKITLDDGSKLLIEGDPSLLDHIAICPKGVWDKGGEAAGVQSDAIGDSVMTEEEKLAAAKKDADEKEMIEKAKADADTGDKLDKVLKGIDACMGAMDSFGKRMDSFEEGRKADAARMDALEDMKKGDAEGEPGSGKDDPKQVAADKKDAEDKEKADAAEGATTDARIDATSLDAIRKDIAAIQVSLPKHTTDADYISMAQAQARADSVFNAFGERAPRPLLGEDLLAYRKRLTTELKKHSPTWAKTELAAIADSATFDAIETQVYADATRTGHSPATVAPGTMREIVTTDEVGRRMVSFVGEPKTWMGSFTGRSRRLTGINKTGNMH